MKRLSRNRLSVERPLAGTTTSAIVCMLAIAVCGPLRGEFLYVLGTFHLSVFTIDSATGYVRPIPGSPFATLGTSPMVLSPATNFLFVDDSNRGISGYKIDPATGAPSPTPTAGSPLFIQSNGWGMTVSPNGRFLYGVDQWGGDVVGITVDPSTGALSPMPGSPFPSGSSPITVAADPTGRFLYAVTSLASRVSEYTIDPQDGFLTPITGPPLPQIVGLISIAVDPKGRFVFLGQSQIYDGNTPLAGSISVYRIDAATGALSAVPGSPRIPAAYSIVVHPSGKFVYVASPLSLGSGQEISEEFGSIYEFAVDPETGALSAIPGSPLITTLHPLALTLDCAGTFVYVLAEGDPNLGEGSIKGYKINAETGVLTEVAESPFATGMIASNIAAAGCTQAPPPPPDNTKPVSHVLPLPAVELSPRFHIAWSGTDTGSGIRDYTIYMSDNGDPFNVLFSKTGLTGAYLTGLPGHTYGFYSIARDWALNVEDPKFSAEATTPLAAPASRVSWLPVAELSPNFQVQWSGTGIGGAGTRSYTIYVSDNGGPFTPWLTHTAARQGWYAGFLDHTYGFFSIAQDVTGNEEPLKSVADAATQTPAPPMPADVNGDGQITCVDVALVKASFGQKDSPLGSNPADVNKDGVINVLDIAKVTQKLAPGTNCQ